MQYLIENAEELLSKLDFPKKTEYKDCYLNKALTYWAFFGERKCEIQQLTGESAEAIIYTKYFWCTAFIKRFEKLSDDEKCACLIALCESILPKLAGLGGAKFASDVLKKCRQWLESKNVEADYLYSLLESENDICVFQFLNDEKDSEKENVLQCLSTALAYIILLAYRFENQVYLPEPIECVDSETVEYLFCHFQKLCPNSDLLEKLLPSENKN